MSAHTYFYPFGNHCNKSSDSEKTYLYPPQNECFRGYTGIACMSVRPCLQNIVRALAGYQLFTTQSRLLTTLGKNLLKTLW